MVELTEALTHLPAGGQVVLSDVTYHRIKDRLLEVQLPAFTFQCARSSLEAITDRTLSKFVEQVLTTAAVIRHRHAYSWGKCAPYLTSHIFLQIV